MEKKIFILSIILCTQLFGQFRAMKVDSFDTPYTVSQWEKANPDTQKINPTAIVGGVVAAGAVAAGAALLIESGKKKADLSEVTSHKITNGYMVLKEFDDKGKKISSAELTTCCNPGFNRVVHNSNIIECSDNWTLVNTPNPSECAYYELQKSNSEKKILL